MMKKLKTKKLTVECLSCSQDITVGRSPKVGNFLTCDSCDSQFQIIAVEPVRVDWSSYDEYSDDEDLYDDIDDEDQSFYQEYNF